jgi:outer membrane scaffolding protein for murein synthesis (MipA/OmpV family)
MGRPVAALVVLAALASLPHTSRADPRPLWELGLGPGLLALPDYRGADSAHAYLLPVPNFVYRGKVLKADRDGLRGMLFDRRYVALNLSLSATPPVRSNAARAGMPDLRPTVEAGPAIASHLWHSADRKAQLDFVFSVRAAVTIEARPSAVGWQFDPHLNLDVADLFRHPGVKLGVRAGPLFANRRYNDYFYTVAPQFATPGRPAYQASAGYAGAQTLLSLSRRYSRYWTGAYVRYDSLSGAVFAASPLMKRNSYWSAGVAFTWMISRSSQKVDAAE